jgi:hypothetical protein
MCPIVASPGVTLVTRPYRLDGPGGVTASTQRVPVRDHLCHRPGR